MIGCSQDPEKAVAAIFNSAVAATAISAAWEIGLFDELKNKGRTCVSEFSREHELDNAALEGLVSALAVVNIINREDNAIVPGQLFDETLRTKSFFHWLTVGSGEMFARAPSMFAHADRKGDFYNRDAKAIAYACSDINREHFDPVFRNVLDKLDVQFHAVADLGCGSGERLVHILGRDPKTTGLGIDIAQPAIDYARERATVHGMVHRLSFVKGDVCELEYRDEFADVDLLTCFLMGHDFWPRKHCIATLSRLRRTFPNVRRFILGDTVRVLLDNAETREAVSENDVPVFTLGFEFGHALMGVYLPTIEEWEGVFGASGWHCTRQHAMKSPSRSVIFELEPIAGSA